MDFGLEVTQSMALETPRTASASTSSSKVKLGLLASGKLKYGTWDSQKQPYTVQTILGNFR